MQGLSRPPIRVNGRARRPPWPLRGGAGPRSSLTAERPQPLLRLPQPRRGALLAEALVLDAVRLQERRVGHRRRPGRRASRSTPGSSVLASGSVPGTVGTGKARRAQSPAGPSRARRPRRRSDGPGRGSEHHRVTVLPGRVQYHPIVVGPARTRRRHHVAEGRDRTRGGVLSPFRRVRFQLFGITQRTLEAASTVRRCARRSLRATWPTPTRRATAPRTSRSGRSSPSGCSSIPTASTGRLSRPLGDKGTTTMRVDGSNVDVDHEATDLAESRSMYRRA